MNKLTIQINNLEALERLIGGDAEVEVDIRNSVAQKFAEKHLKALITSAPIASTLATLKTEILNIIQTKCNEEFASFKSDWYGGIKNVSLHPAIQTEIDKQVRTIIDDVLRKAVDKSLEFWGNNADLEKRIEKRFEYYTEEHINAEIKARLEKVKASL